MVETLQNEPPPDPPRLFDRWMIVSAAAVAGFAFYGLLTFLH